MNRCYFLIIFCFLFFPVAVHAQCTMPDDRPDAEAGVIVFNTDHKVMQYCNGDKWVGLRGGGGGVQRVSGEVVAFDLATCPEGWSEYLPARGRFIRGIDNGAGNDPDGTRAAGNVQADDFKSHDHPFKDGADWRITAGVGSPYGGLHSTGSWQGNTNRAGIVGLRGGAETRPKNVALLYCRKN